jgi:hypothetical protein
MTPDAAVAAGTPGAGDRITRWAARRQLSLRELPPAPVARGSGTVAEVASAVRSRPPVIHELCARHERRPAADDRQLARSSWCGTDERNDDVVRSRRQGSR